MADKQQMTFLVMLKIGRKAILNSRYFQCWLVRRPAGDGIYFNILKPRLVLDPFQHLHKIVLHTFP
jgi:hypothetical protein